MAVPSPPILDTFVRANETPLSGGGNWTTKILSSEENLVLINNSIASAAAALGTGWWTRFVCSDAELMTLDENGSGMTLRARIQNPGTTIPTYYEVIRVRDGSGNDGKILIRVSRAGVVTTLADLGLQTIDTDNSLGMTLIGDTVQAWKYTASTKRWSLLGSGTGTTPVSGYGFVGVGVRSGGLLNFAARSLDPAMSLQTNAYTEGLR